MPRKKTHEDQAAKMRAYRSRKRLELMTLEALADQVAELERRLAEEKAAREAAESQLAGLLGIKNAPAEDAEIFSFDGSSN